MPTLRLLTVLAILALVLGGCATMDVGSYGERGVDFAQYRTYDWGPADALPTGDPRLDANPFFQDHFQGAVERQLARKGFGRVDDNPDLLIHYHANITQRIDVNGVDRSYGYCSGEDCQPNVTEYDSGTLVLDFVDTRTKKVVWRGWAQNNMEGVIANQDRLERHIDQAVRRMLEQFPATL